MNATSAHFARGVDTNVRFWIECIGPGQNRSHDLIGELPNILQAVHYGLGLPKTRSEAVRLLYLVHRTVERGGWWSRWLALCDTVLQTGTGDDWSMQVRLLIGRGVLRRYSVSLDMALADHRLAEQLAREAGDELLRAQALYHCALDCLKRYDLDEAENCAREALNLFAATSPGDIWHAAALNSLGEAARGRGKYESAVDYYSQSVTIFERLGDTTDLAKTLNNLGNSYQGQQRWSDAATCFENGLRHLKGSDDELTKSLLHSNYGIVFYEQGDFRRAELEFREADTIALRQSGNTFMRGSVAQNIGSALMEQGAYVEAESYLRRAASIWKQSNNELSLGNTIGTLARLHALKGEVSAALNLYDESLALLSQFPDHGWAQQISVEFSTARQETQQAAAATTVIE